MPSINKLGVPAPFRYVLFFGLLLGSAFYSHQAILSSLNAILGFPLSPIYLFHSFFSLLICILLWMLSRSEHLAPQLGFIYLAGFLLKFFVFALIFQEVLLRESAFTVAESVSLLIPLALFLGLEVVLVAKILRGIDQEQK